MSNLEIKVNIPRLLEYSSSLRASMDDKSFISLIRSFSQYIMDLYMRLIEEAIYSRRYRGEWEPISDKGYIKYLDTTPKNNIVTIMREALEVQKIGRNYIIRFTPHYNYPGTRIPLVRVLRAIDRGTTDFNARPLFDPILRDINSHILDLWRGYLKMKNII